MNSVNARYLLLDVVSFLSLWYELRKLKNLWLIEVLKEVLAYGRKKKRKV